MHGIHTTQHHPRNHSNKIESPQSAENYNGGRVGVNTVVLGCSVHYGLLRGKVDNNTNIR